MRLAVQKKCMCFILTLMMVVLGMCFDTVKADACFSAVQSPYESDISYTNKDTLTKQYAFVEEQGEKCEISQKAGQVSRRKETRSRNLNNDIILWTELAPEKSLHSYSEIAHYLESEHSMSAAIISYVHHQDGSKE